jgi:hypothetical protein
VATDVDVEPRPRGRGGHVEGLAPVAEGRGQRFGDGGRPVQARYGDRAMVEGHQRVAAGRHQPGARPSLDLADMQDDPAPALAMSVEEGRHLRLDPCLGQRPGDDAALPRRVGLGGEMLHGTAAAGRVIGTERLDPVGRGRLDRDQDAVPGLAAHPHPLAGQGAGHKQAVLGDSVAAGTEPGDRQGLFSLRHHTVAGRL